MLSRARPEGHPLNGPADIAGCLKVFENDIVGAGGFRHSLGRERAKPDGLRRRGKIRGEAFELGTLELRKFPEDFRPGLFPVLLEGPRQRFLFFRLQDISQLEA